MKKIDSKDISFVVQGKNVKFDTKHCLQSIRKYFPKATIIFSTYLDENVSGLDFDILVRSKDPGAPRLNKHSFNQLNRILLTTQKGLEKVETKYCARLRSDLIFKNDHILYNWASKFPKRDEKYSVFKSRVCFFQLWTRLAEDVCGHYIPTPFYFSDWFCFGFKEDILNYFNSIPLVKEPDFSNHFKHAQNRLKKIFDGNDFRKFHPEQHCGTSFFKQFFKEANLKNFQDFSEKKMEISNHVLANNIITLGYSECGIFINKKPYSKIVKKEIYPENSLWLKDICTHYKFMCLYKKYCDPDFVIPFRYRCTQELRIDRYITHLQVHIQSLLKPIKIFFHWFNNIFSIVYYIVKIIFKAIYWAPYVVYKQIKNNR